ncbi:uncharacterized protein involved in type VI secretion and phage assembly [Paenibacillus mucilaginosus]|uniref:phage baseplate assembly protein V n=1 Tax=Paenibacillus mucilaginosus TaxID=61624 RepID=UPI003D20D786
MSLYDALGERREGLYQKADGVMVAVVTNNKDPEGLGRVRLKLPLRETETETGWTRVATLMAGNDRGTYFVPEVGDEVLVAFHLGELRNPFVIGTLWNSVHKAPKANEENHIRKIRSKSGHELLFSDDPKSAKVNIVSAKGYTIEIDDTSDTVAVSTPNSSSSVKLKGGSSEEITLTSMGTQITITGNGEVKISAPKSIALNAPEIKIEAAGSLSLKGGIASVQSDGLTTIKGSLVKIN